MSTTLQLGDIPVSWIIMIHGFTPGDGVIFPKKTVGRWIDKGTDRQESDGWTGGMKEEILGIRLGDQWELATN